MENAQPHLAAVLMVKKFNFYAARSSHVSVGGRCLIMNYCEEAGAICLLGILPTGFGFPTAASFTDQTSPVPHQRRAPTPEHLGWPPTSTYSHLSVLCWGAQNWMQNLLCPYNAFLPGAEAPQPKQSTAPHQLLDCFFFFCLSMWLTSFEAVCLYFCMLFHTWQTLSEQKHGKHRCISGDMGCGNGDREM